VCLCVSVALGIQHAMRMRSIVICGLPRSTVFFHINTAILEKKVTEHKISDFNAIWIFSIDFRKILKYQI